MNQLQAQAQAQPQKPITEQVLERLGEMRKTQDLQLPAGYSASNALNAAYLELQKVKNRQGQSALQTCTPTSISQALLDMVLQGLTPAKNQCYFIAYGKELQMQRSYFGTVAALKRLKAVNKVVAEVVHQGDTFELGSNEDMELIVKNFVPSFENQDKPLIGAFAMITTDSGKYFTVMTKAEIDQSWAQTRQRDNKVQKNFSQEMAKRTVLNRAAKMFINTSDDSDLLTGAINNTTSNEYENERVDVTPSENAGSQVQQALLNKAMANTPASEEKAPESQKPAEFEPVEEPVNDLTPTEQILANKQEGAVDYEQPELL